MASTARTTLRAGGLRALNQPRAVRVEVGGAGQPLALVGRDGESNAVGEIVDRWRIVDEWWRERRIERDYFRLALVDGQQVIVFHDAVDDCWYRQSY